MKRGCLLIIIILVGLLLSVSSEPIGNISSQNSDDLIRLHVLANSDSERDQALKYLVKDAIVKDIADKFNASKDINESREILLSSLPHVEDIATTTLQELGSSYSVQAHYGRFFFPTKYYGSFSLPAGEYEAVKVVIGEGQGANWWCVLFPPLCFVPTDKEIGDEGKAKKGYPLKSPEMFTKDNYKVSFKFLQWAKNSFPTLARIFN